MSTANKGKKTAKVIPIRPVKNRRAPVAKVAKPAKVSATESLKDKLERERLIYTAKANRNTSVIDSQVERMRKLADEKLRIKTAKADAVIANRAATAKQKQDARDAKVHAKEAHEREKNQIKLDRDRAVAQMRIDLTDQLQQKQAAMIAQDATAPVPAGSSAAPLPFEPVTSSDPVATVPSAGESPVTNQDAVDPHEASDFEDMYQDSEVSDVWGDIPEKDIGNDAENVEANNERFDITEVVTSFDQPSFEGVSMNRQVDEYIARVRSRNPVLAKFIAAELDRHDLSEYDDGLSAGDGGFLKSISAAASKAINSYGDYVADRINKKNPVAQEREKEAAKQKEIEKALAVESTARKSSFFGGMNPFLEQYGVWLLGGGLLLAGYFLFSKKKGRKRSR